MSIFERFNRQACLNNSIGVVASIGYMEIIPKNTSLPFTYSTTFSTYIDNQSAVELKVQQQNSFGIKDICCVDFGNIPPAPKGVPQITITFNITKKKKMTIKASIVQIGYTQEYGAYLVE